MFLQASWQKLPPSLALILEAMAMSGLRLGECLAMRGDNLDGRHCQYQVTESTRARRFGPPKTGKRLMDLDPGLVTKLEGHLRRQRQTSLAAGSPREGISSRGSPSAWCSGPWPGPVGRRAYELATP